MSQVPAIPMKRLFLVTVEVELVCWAETESEARSEGQRHAREELMNRDGADYATPITREKDVPYEWRDSIPYGQPPEVEEGEEEWPEQAGPAARMLEEKELAAKREAEFLAKQGTLPLGTETK